MRPLAGQQMAQQAAQQPPAHPLTPQATPQQQQLRRQQQPQAGAEAVGVAQSPTPFAAAWAGVATVTTPAQPVPTGPVLLNSLSLASAPCLLAWRPCQGLHRLTCRLYVAELCFRETRADPDQPARAEALIWHSSDIAAQPIVGNAKIERLAQPRFNERMLPVPAWVRPLSTHASCLDQALVASSSSGSRLGMCAKCHQAQHVLQADAAARLAAQQQLHRVCSTRHL